LVRDTSVKTYYELVDEGFVSDRCQLVYNYLKLNPNLTDTELAHGLDFDDPNAVRPRRKDLLDARLVADTGKRVCTITGRTCYQWAVKNFVELERKEVLAGDLVFRTFTSRTLLEAISLATAYVLKYSDKSYETYYTAALFIEKVYKISVCRKSFKRV